VPGTERFEGRGVYFGATAMEARMCAGEEVVIVGGGNSAGQAAVFLDTHARQVHIAIRSENLDHSMSRYLIHRIDALPNVTLHPFTEVVETRGEDELTGVSLVDRKSGNRDEYDCRNLFVFIGAQPNTGWLGDCIALDDRGFVLTGRDIAPEELSPERWGAARQPYLLETSRPGIFAVGDVRSGSTKRVASAVGEGSIAVQFVHAFLGGAV
jgi:thioredoxin reductase (NADPH)